MREKNIRPCPFCGGAAGISMTFTDDGGPSYVVQCVDCGAQGPINWYEIDAIHDWNDRVDKPNHTEGEPEMKKEIKIKACPFCGGAGKLIDIYEGYKVTPVTFKRYRVFCDRCGIETDIETKENAIRKWNRRETDE